jgi:hypothetical protein
MARHGATERKLPVAKGNQAESPEWSSLESLLSLTAVFEEKHKENQCSEIHLRPSAQLRPMGLFNAHIERGLRMPNDLESSQISLHNTFRMSSLRS